jgi:hypothetical protein
LAEKAMSENEGMRSCFKYGCFGCLSLVAVGFVIVFLLSAIRMANDGEPTFEEKSSEQMLPPLPEPPEPPEPPEAPESPESPFGGGGLSAEPNETRHLEMPNLGAPLGTIEVDLDIGDFTIKPGPAGEPIRVEADYDTSKFELREEMIQKPDGTWTYKVNFGAKGGFFGLALGGGNSGKNKVEIIVPRGRPLVLKGSIRVGESKTDLGGLWIKDIDLEYKAGDHFLEFREPLPFPMDQLKIQGSMGGLEIRGLGQASPRVVDVKQGMGELFLDLQGDWRNDAKIRTRFSMGGCKIWLPEKANIDLKRASVSMGEARTDKQKGETQPDWPTLTIDASGSMGELKIER